MTFTLTNKGDSPLTGLNPMILGGLGQPISDFAQSNTCGGQVGAQATCTFSVTSPAAPPGSGSGSLLLFDSEIGTSPQSVSLQGAGAANPVPLMNQPLVPG